MNKIALHNLNIDQEFKNLSPERTQEYLEKFEEELVDAGCREPIRIWNGYIVDGHLRYDICHKWEIPFPIAHIRFQSREAAVSWICREQLKKDCLTDMFRRYLIGKYYISERIVMSAKESRDEHQLVKTEKSQFAGISIGQQYGISCHTVYKYGMMAAAIDQIFRKEPELSHRILSGQTRISYENVVRLSKLSKDKLRSLNRYLSDSRQDHILHSDIQHEIQKPLVSLRAEPLQSRNVLPPVKVGIKDLPQFDPDAEISSLSLTIPSWISSIERVGAATKLDLVSRKARIKISEQLTNLCKSSETLLEAIKEK